MLISPAYAQAGDPTGGLMSLAPLVLIFVVFYFILIRPQQRKAREHREMLAQLKRGDRVVTGGGVLATVIRVTPESDEVVVEISKNPQVRVTVAKNTIASVLREETEAKPAEETAEAKSDRKPRKKERAEAEPAAEAQPAAETPAEPPPANDQPPPRQG
ncbi:preprotein translocase subunit YajC [Elioraea sp. Yellowstone]|jgi:preprotein translocase subunit YajC|uniref:preprotein translocase subunit YajC n=1 Tax=Elioraea sp. Yellowstone TaxID=2592070 RepID=UPI0011520826|nr:preprotein translocase subunit YajC [Elioraea sp. Yellowstone]